jgi:hypothetical protein
MELITIVGGFFAATGLGLGLGVGAAAEARNTSPAGFETVEAGQRCAGV